MNKYYVYQHVDNDGTVMYTGMGSGHRVWSASGRDKEHKEWMLSLMPSNFKWIIINENLTQSEAFALEKSLIKALPTKFNKQKSGSLHPLFGKEANNKKAVINLDTGEVFSSIKKAANSVGLHEQTIGRLVRVRGTALDQQKAGGYYWSFYESA